MNSYKQITYKYLKQQRNRTLLTIVGIILSVAMISSIGTIIEGARNSLIKEAIRENGSYHVSFSNLVEKDIHALENHVEIEEVGISKKEGSARIVEITKEEKEMYGDYTSYRYIEVEGYGEKTLNLLPFKVSEGRMPTTSKEIAIEKWMLNYFKEDVKLGDNIKLSLGDRKLNDNKEEIGFELIDEKEYTLVGFIEPKFEWKGNLITKGITGLDEKDNTKRNYNAYIKLTNIKNAQEKANTIAENIEIDSKNISLNNRVLRLSAESADEMFNGTLKTVVAFIVGLIVISTIAVIYNAFNISVLERISQFGLLRSIGATPSQIRGIVLKEALILSVISIPIGLLSGVGAMKIVFYIIGKLKNPFVFYDMEANISLTVFLISTLIGLMTVFLSAIGPARKAGKVSPLEAVRNTGSFKKETFKKTKNYSLIRRILGIEGEIAYKNLRRNRKRFIITVFSMVISISLFITFSSFSDYMFKSGIVDTKSFGNYSMQMKDTEVFDTIYEELKAIKDVRRVYKLREISGEALLEESKISKEMKKINTHILNDKKENLIAIHNVRFHTIGDENLDLLKSVLNEGSVNLDDLEKDNGVLVINNTYVYNMETGKQKLIEGYQLKSGDKIPFAPYSFNEEDKDLPYKELNVVGVLEREILEDGYNLNGSINIITTEKNMKNILGEHIADSSRIIIEMEDNFDSEPIKSYLEGKENIIPYFNYIDYAEMAEQNESATIVTSIFLYGFVTLITLISSINIINTISTNIILRTKEISMIKAVGMTQGGIKRMVALESLFYGVYAAIIGGVIGTGLAYVMFTLVIRIREFQWIIPWKNIGIACIGATIVALFSGILPLKRINEGIIVENMKADE